MSVFRAKRGFDVNAALTGVVAGVAAMYFLDTQSGRRRRALVRDKVLRAQHVATETLVGVEHDVQNRSRGALVRLARVFRTGPVDDGVLLERVRAKLGHVCSHPRAIEVASKGNGCIELKGPVLARERFEILAAISMLPGVKVIDDDLEVHATADVAALEGDARHAPFLARHWNPTTRFIVGATGALLGMRGLSGGVFAIPRLLIGSGLIGVAIAPSAITTRPGKALEEWRGNQYDWSAASPSAW